MGKYEDIVEWLDNHFDEEYEWKNSEEKHLRSYMEQIIEEGTREDIKLDRTHRYHESYKNALNFAKNYADIYKTMSSNDFDDLAKKQNEKYLTDWKSRIGGKRHTQIGGIVGKNYRQIDTEYKEETVKEIKEFAELTRKESMRQERISAAKNLLKDPYYKERFDKKEAGATKIFAGVIGLGTKQGEARRILEGETPENVF